jgi:SEC-C motif
MRDMTDEPAPAPSSAAVGTVALAWLPAGDYERALELWPDFAASDRVAGPDGPLSHRQYCQAMQQKLVEFAEVGFPGLAIAPIRVGPFTAWCAEKGQEPDSSEARAEYAAHLAATGDPDVTSWPPGRNQPCWCGSGRKYKKCCAATSLVDAR